MIQALGALGLLVSLILIVVAVMKRVNYGLALLMGAITLGIFSQLSSQQFVDVFRVALTDITTWDLALVVSLIPILAHCMKETGMVEDLIKSIKGVLSSRAVLMILPALMGALPMPGGALFSAPLINEEAERLKISSEERSFINVWFRHWSFFIYPLASPMILAATLTGVSLYSLILIQFLPVLLYLLLGYLVSIRKIGDGGESGGRRDMKTFLSIPANMSPIILAVLLNVFGVDMVVALAIGVAYVLIINRVKPRRAAALLRQGFDWRLQFAILGVMCLRKMIEISGAVSAVLPYMEATGLPTTFLLITIAWTVGLATAMPSAGIAIIISLAVMAVENLTAILTSILYLTMVFSYLISPLHLCLVLTVEYYKSHLHTVYRKLIPTAVATYLAFLASALMFL